MTEIRTLPWNGLKVASLFAGGGGSSTGYRMAGCRVIYANEREPAACDTYRANMAAHTYLDDRDVRTVTPESLLECAGLAQGELDLFDGSPPCFPTGTPVVTARGVIGIEDVQVGDLVLTHRQRWRPVTATMSREADVMASYRWLTATPDHPFLTRTAHDADPDWTPFEQARGSYLAIPTAPEPLATDPCPIGDSPQAWWLVGRWLGDGWLRLSGGTHGEPPGERIPLSRTPRDCHCGKPAARHSRYPNLWTSYCSPTHRAAAVRRRRPQSRADVIICSSFDEADGLASKLAGTGLSWRTDPQRTTMRFTASDARLVRWLDRWFGHGAAGKTIPGWALAMPENNRAALLDGYLSADGYLNPNGGWTVPTVSRNLATATRLLATGLGWTTSLRVRDLPPTAVIEGRTINQRPQWVVGLNRDDGRYTQMDGHRWVRLRQRPVPVGRAVVYDLTVAGDHSFIAHGFAVHNCNPFSTAGKRQAGWGKVQTKHAQRDDDLFYEYIRLLAGVQPRVFVAENVSGLVKGVARGYFREILTAMRATGYQVECKLLDAQWLGVPQARQRLIFVGVRQDLVARGFIPAHPDPLPYFYSVRDALPHLAGYRYDTSGNFGVRELDVDSDPAPSITVANGFGGGPVDPDRPSPTVLTGQGNAALYLDPETGASLKVTATRGLPGAYGPAPLDRDRPANTVTTVGDDSYLDAETGQNLALGNHAIGAEWDRLQPGEASEKYFSLKRPDPDAAMLSVTAGGGNISKASVTHPVQRRKLTIAELRRICSFPDDYVLTGSFSQRWERMGMSVPPVMMRAVAEVLRDRILLPARTD